MHSNEQVLPVVVFTGGPSLDGQVLDFIHALDNDATIDLLAIFSQSPVRGLSGIVADVCKRRGILAPAILLRNAIAACFSIVTDPRLRLTRHRTRTSLGPRIRYCDDIHDSEVLATVRSLRPSLGLVYGGPIIKPELYTLPAMGTLGIHHGNVPEYRGKKTTFWALYNGEPEVSVIIQRIGSKLDAGDIVRRVDVPVNNRPLPVIRNILERKGIELYLRAVRDVGSGAAQFTKQAPTSGKLYKDPDALDIVRYWLRYARRILG